MVTENAADFMPLLNSGALADRSVPPVVLALKRNLPRQAGALDGQLAHRSGSGPNGTPTRSGTCTGWGDARNLT